MIHICYIICSYTILYFSSRWLIRLEDMIPGRPKWVVETLAKYFNDGRFLESRKETRIGRIGASGHQVIKHSQTTCYVTVMSVMSPSVSQRPECLRGLLRRSWSKTNLLDVVIRRWAECETRQTCSKWKGEVCDGLWLRMLMMLHATLWRQSGIWKDAQMKIRESLHCLHLL